MSAFFASGKNSIFHLLISVLSLWSKSLVGLDFVAFVEKIEASFERKKDKEGGRD